MTAPIIETCGMRRSLRQWRQDFAGQDFLCELDVSSLGSSHACGSVVDLAGISSEWTSLFHPVDSPGAKGCRLVDERRLPSQKGMIVRFALRESSS